jgi:Fe2+ or Zn2+ uptake regulation protein
MVLAAIDPDGEMSRALRAAGLRVTMPRLAMLTWLDGHPHATVDAIAAGVRERFGTVSTQAVYDPARFERRVGNHHHLLCRRCGRTEDVDAAIGAQPCLTAAEELGFAVDEAEVVFWGVCPACKAAESSADGVQRDEEVWQ